MKNPRGHVKRLLLAAGLALTVSATAVFGAMGTTAAAPPLTLEPVEISVGGHEVTVQVRASEEVAFSHSLTRTGTVAPAGTAALVNPIRRPLDGVRAPLGAGGPIADPVREPVYTAASKFKLTGLSSNTTYTLFVRATNRAGQQVTVQQTFTTLKQRVRVTLREIKITDDGDWFGDGEPGWIVKLDWSRGSVAGCFPNTDVGFGGVCQTGSYGEGRIFPRNNRGDSLAWIFAEENFDTMPAEFTLDATAKEEDWFPVVSALATLLEDCLGDGVGCGFSNTVGSPSWKAPQGVEWASTPAIVAASDHGTGFESTLMFTFELFHDNLSYPSARNAPSSTWRSPFGR